MIFTDCHVHSLFSSDSETPVEQMIEKAISLGFSEFYLTDHMDYDFPPGSGLDFLFSPRDYFDKLSDLRETYKSKINIRAGIELGLKTTSSVLAKIGALLDVYSFDLIIGSTHLVRDLDPYAPDFWEQGSEEECMRLYYRQVLENITAFSGFHVLAHLDYPVRYVPSGRTDFSYDMYAKILDEILEFIIGHDIALEVNTAGLKYALGEPNPRLAIIKRYLSLGGQHISIGSDAHVPEYYGYCFEKAKHLLLDAGVRFYTIFKEGKPILLPL